MGFLSLFKRASKEKVWRTPNGQRFDLFSNMLSQPHLLIAGTTGSGKSVLVDGLMSTALYRMPFDTLGGAQFLIIDPKGTELDDYAALPHTLRYSCAVEDFPAVVQYAVNLMERRNAATKAARQRDPSLSKTYAGSDVFLVIDEWADLMNTCKKSVLPLVQRIAQRGRSARIHIILVTQTPLAKILPTEVRCNFDSRVGLRTRDAGQSKLIVGFSGLENLPRYGQGYYMTPEDESYWNIPYVEQSEIDRLIAWWMQQKSA